MESKDLLTNRSPASSASASARCWRISILAEFGAAVRPGRLDPESGQRALEAAIPFGQAGLCWRCSGCCSRSPARRSKPASPTLIRSPILRLGMGPPQEAVGSAALHRRLDRAVRARAPDRADRRRRDELVEFAVLFSILVLPLTYLPLLLLPGTRLHGRACQRPVAKALGWLYFALIAAAALAALPLVHAHLGRPGMKPNDPIKLVSHCSTCRWSTRDGAIAGSSTMSSLTGGQARGAAQGAAGRPGAYRGRMPRLVIGWSRKIAGDRLTRVPMAEDRNPSAARSQLTARRRGLGLHRARRGRGAGSRKGARCDALSRPRDKKIDRWTATRLAEFTKSIATAAASSR